ncbi:MAG: Type I Iterative PKS [Cirrosporium novae-zelandiae]|nr:MAG: Type I Iterative PKS [Cirrosporium novae-zelandiae]
MPLINDSPNTSPNLNGNTSLGNYADGDGITTPTPLSSEDMPVNGGTNGHAADSPRTNGAGPVMSGTRTFGDKTIPIAIVGMSCRFPGDATDPEKLWKLLVERQSAWSEIPKCKFNADAFYHPDPSRSGTTNVRGGHFLKEDLAYFDASFFGISPNEAKAIDPQHRLQLESAYEALENAGIPIKDIIGTDTGVYTGVFNHDYKELSHRDPENIPIYHATGTGMAMLSNRLSYFFDLKGPSISIDTACSSSLTALHLACMSLRAGESPQAIVGGTNAIFSPDSFLTMTRLNFLGPEGKSYAYDHRAAGYGRGEGVGTVILKPLYKALRDGNPIRAIIRESATNCDGRTMGITLPSRGAQEVLVRQAYKNAGLDPAVTDFVEAHGTGTPAGDPLEAGAIGAAFGPGRSPDRPLYVGSIKTNLGHLEGSSGVAAVIKTTLALEKGLIPPNINFEEPNSRIPMEDWKIKIPLEPLPWPSTEVRRASINNFGYGGSNVHVILESTETYLKSHGLSINSASQPLPADEIARKKIATFTANDETACKNIAANVATYLKAHADCGTDLLDNLTFTLNQKRSTFPFRMAFATSSVADLTEKLEAKNLKVVRASKEPKLAFVFTGQGAQWATMGHELMDFEPFKASMIKADQCLKSLGCTWSLNEELSRHEKVSKISAPLMSQPLCTAIQLALVDLLSSWGIRPGAVTGHSSGEIAAAYAAGAFDHDTAMKVAYFRGVVSSKVANMEKLSGGMMAVGLSREKAEPYVAEISSGKLVVACVNSPKSVTISGDLVALNELGEKLEAQKIFNRKLRVEVAYHSHHMKEVAEEYLNLMDFLTPSPSSSGIDFYSSVSGSHKSLQDLDATYWVANMTSPVLFTDSLQNLCLGQTMGKKRRRRAARCSIDGLIEIGPHSALEGPIKQILAGPDFKDSEIFYGSCLKRKVDATQTALDLAGLLFVNGYPIDFNHINFPGGTSELRLLTDLPSYPWNHTAKHWHESRLSKNYRHRSSPRRDLLGAPVNDFNLVEPRWQNFIRVSENPWVRDHIIQGATLYPAAGIMIMAIEAMLQVETAKFDQITSFKLRDINIGKALVVPESAGGVETLFTLRPCDNSLESSESWREFRVFSIIDQGNLIEHCRGLVSAVFDAKTGEVDGGREASMANETLNKILDSFNLAHLESVNVEKLYEALGKAGLQYGQTFQNLVEIHSGQNKSLSVIKVPDTATVMPYNFEYPHILHPATLDTALQSMFPALCENITDLSNPMVPIFIKELCVSNQRMSVPGTQYRAYSTAEFQGFRNAVGNITIIDDKNGTPIPVIEIKGLKCASLTTEMIAEDGDSNPRKLCFKMVFDDEIDLVKAEDSNVVFPGRPRVPAESAMISDIEEACYYYIKSSLSDLTDDDVQNLPWYYKLYYNWIKAKMQLAEEGKLPHQTAKWLKSTPEEKQSQYEKLLSLGTEGRAMHLLGENLTSILRGKIDALQLMLKDDLLYSLYGDALGIDRVYEHMSNWVDKFAHKRPDAHILEIGAGTGGASLPVLQALGGYGGKYPRFSQYDFTDISGGFFEKAQEKFKAWGSLIKYKRLNIERDPGEQGFEYGKYDLIVASNVLHATENMNNTMTNVRKLLKPGGKLILMEITRSLLHPSMFFGTLPGAGEGRTSGPTMPEDQWDALFQRTQFSGLNFSLQDYPDEEDKLYSVLITTATSPSTPKYPGVVVIHNNDLAGLPLDSLNTKIKKVTGIEPEKYSFDDDLNFDITGKICLFLGEVSHPLLSTLHPFQFEALKRMFTAAKGILWVTRGGTIEGPEPEANLVAGLARSIRNENSAIKFITLDLDIENPLAEKTVTTIVRLFKTSFEDVDLNQGVDVEFIERNGRIEIPRVLTDDSMDDVVHTETHPPPSIQQAFHQAGRPLKLEIGTPGLLDSLLFVDDTVRSKLLAKGEVEIEVQATGINSSDIMVTMGQVTGYPLGLECSGVVAMVGEGVNHLKVGDRVSTIALGAFSNYVRCPESWVQPIPDDITFEVAASIPIAFSTAYYTLFDIARVQKGESVLIHAAAGDIGQAMITLAKMAEAEIFITVGTIEERDFIMEKYAVQEDHIFSSKDTTFVDGIRRMTNNRGVDVVLRSLAKDLLRETWNCVAAFGRFVEIGKRDSQSNARLDMGIFSRNCQFCSVDMALIFRERKELAGRVFSDVMGLLRKGTVKAAQAITVYSPTNIEDAFRSVQAEKHIGKVVIKSSSDDIVKVAPRPPNEMQLREDSSYLLVGGLGGLGRAISKWMAENGGKNLIFLSRSGASSKSASSLVKELEDIGAHVAVYKCDVSEEDELTKALDQAAKEMPKIRGVVHAGMVLRDSIFENMTFEAHQDVLRPKVKGTLNLHRRFSKPDDLDFFVMFSSTAGMAGTKGQASYAASSTFQDAVAHMRTAQYLPAASIDIGVILDVGYVAENQNVSNNLARWGFVGIHYEEFLAMIKAAFTKPLQTQTQTNCQLITGLGSKAMVDGTAYSADTEIPYWLQDVRFNHLWQLGKTTTTQQSGDETERLLPEQLEEATSLLDATKLICNAMISKMSKMLVMPVTDLHASQPMSAYGVDSLVAVELRNWIFREIKADVPVFELLGNGSLMAVAGVVAGRSKLVRAEVKEEVNGEGEGDGK